MAPEILNEEYYGKKVDIWSLGVTLFEALFKQLPFNG
jgi:serine/threonine protein kinase